ncbi:MULTISPECIES: hypothetical protein [Streptomyces]|uniref:Uncharacterized protein n=1 Tax=Streptomyces spororaveus TaxID=284039 RepID=A0ABQ3T4N1_9ACTN|nr:MULTISPECIES: hypothetical protein [Streptomyces]MCX5308484.1 hypothetical protein [Streptomyces sp. NBC_00160]GHI75322.1 hypothetical protein Sspor_08830 [Streptomyces spororaveus]
MPDAATSASTAPDIDLPDAACRALAEAADAVGEAARYASGLAFGARLPAAALTRGGRTRLGWRTLLRTLTDPAGLGWAPRGRGVARAGRLAGILAGRESLAISIAVCGLKARIRAASAGRPELFDDPGAAAVLAAVGAGRQAEAVRLFRAIMRERGAEHAFALLAPSFADILAWHALTDTNPFNDHAGWQVATGRAEPAEPVLGLGAAFWAFCDRGPGLPEGQAVTGAVPVRGPARRRVTYRPPRPAPRPPAGGLSGRAAALRTHAFRLHAVAAAPEWHGPETEALRAEVARLAARCATAAGGLALAAAQLKPLQDQ